MRRPGLVLALVLAVLPTACAGGESTPSGSGVSAVATVLDPCPEQPAAEARGRTTLPPLAFDCLGGGSVDLGAAPGVPTLVNLWGSWCGPCREELPLLQQFAESAGDRVRVVGVISKDGVAQADSFAADADVTFPSAFDGEGELMTELGLNSLPHTYFVDADGGVRYTKTGPFTSVDELESLVAEHLGVRL